MKSNSEFSIFLVDDDPFFLSVCEQYLHNAGYQRITKFESSTDFLNSLQLQPDLILLDYSMDSLNGIETLKKIKRFNPDLMVVFISGQENIDIAVNALKYGAFDYLIKNQISEEKLKTVIDKGLTLKNLLAKRNKKSVLKRLLPFIGLAVLLLCIYKFYSK
jgi:DNA-binding NtrC family response regulator